MKQARCPFVIGFGIPVRGILIFSAGIVALPGVADITATSSRAWASASATTSWYFGNTEKDRKYKEWSFDQSSGGGGGWASETGVSGITNGTSLGSAGAVVYLRKTLAADRKSASFSMSGGGIGTAFGDGNPPHDYDPVAGAGDSLRSCFVQFTLGRSATFRLEGGFAAGKGVTGGNGTGGLRLQGPSGYVFNYSKEANGTLVKNDPTVTSLPAGNYQLSLSGSESADGKKHNRQFGAGGATVTLYVEEIPAASAQGDEGASSPTLLTSSTNVREFTDVNEAFATWFPVESGTIELQVAASTPTLTFPVTAGLAYAIDWSDDLSVWHRKEIRLAQEGEVQEVFNDLSVDEFTTRRFYKITPYLPSMPGDDDLIEP